LLTLIAENQ